MTQLTLFSFQVLQIQWLTLNYFKTDFFKSRGKQENLYIIDSYIAKYVIAVIHSL